MRKTGMFDYRNAQYFLKKSTIHREGLSSGVFMAALASVKIFCIRIVNGFTFHHLERGGPFSTCPSMVEHHVFSMM